MPQEESFEITLSVVGDTMRVVFEKRDGRVSRFTVQYETLIDNEVRPVRRFDTAHGYAHCDVLGWSGETAR